MRVIRFMFLVFLWAALPVMAEVSDDFSRYQGILDRKPFGEPPPDPAQMAAAVQAEADIFTKPLKMVAIKQEQNGRIRVGFINQAAGNKSYYLTVGETSPDGVELVDADFELESALLKKDSRSGWIYMKTSPQKPASGTGSNAPSFYSASIAKAVQEKRASLYSELLRRRQERSRSREEELSRPAEIPGSAKLNGEQLEKTLKEYQLDAIRKGLKPLPIPLTKEMDDQLVSEGVLPPLQAGQ